MQEYYLRDLISYTSCPLKYKLQQDAGAVGLCDLSSNTIISSALADTYLKACHLFSQRRPFSTQERAKHFSKLWYALKKKFIKHGGSESRAHAQLLSSHNKIIKMSRPIPTDWDASVVDFNTERVMSGYLIKDKLDLVLVNSKNTTEIELVFLDKSLCKESETDFAMHLRAAFNLHYFKGELIGTPGLNIRCVVLNLHHGYRKTLQLKPELLKRYRHTIVDIIKSIELNLYYPRPGIEECKHCLFRNSCHFSQS